MLSEHKPRISLDISQDQEDGMKKFIPHGAKKKIFGFIIDDMLQIMEDEQRRAVFLGAIASRELHLADWFKVLKTTFRKLENQLGE